MESATEPITCSYVLGPNMNEKPDPDRESLSDFERANQEASESFVGEFISFLKENKKWWMAPIFIVLGMLTVLVVFSSSAAAPFIYSLF